MNVFELEIDEIVVERGANPYSNQNQQIYQMSSYLYQISKRASQLLLFLNNLNRGFKQI